VSAILLAVLTLIFLLFGLFLHLDNNMILDRFLNSDHIESYQFLPSLQSVNTFFIVLAIISLVWFISIMWRRNAKLSTLSKISSFMEKKAVHWIISAFLINIIYILITGDYLFGVIYMNPLVLLLAMLPTIIAVMSFSISLISRRLFVAMLLALAISSGIAISVHQVILNHDQTHMSWTNYGESGFADVVKEFQGKCLTSHFIMRYDLGYYICPNRQYNRDFNSIIAFNFTSMRYFYNQSADGPDVYWYPTSMFYQDKYAADVYDRVIAAHHIDYIILDHYSNVWISRPLVAKDYALNRTIGDFEIYTIKNQE